MIDQKKHFYINIRSKIIFTLLLTLFLESTLLMLNVEVPKSSSDSNWPMFQNNRQHTGRSTYLGITTFPVLKWSLQLPGYGGETGAGFSEAPDGTIYVTAYGNLSAIDPSIGEILWTFNGDNSRSTPAISTQGTIYWGYGDTFVALSPTGMVEWAWSNLSLNYVFGSSPIIADDGSVYFDHDGLFSFSENGDLQWHDSFNWFSHSSPAVDADGSIYLGSGDGYLYAYDPSGNIKWKHFINAYGSSPSIGSDRSIYIGTYNSILYAFTPAGDLLWTFETEETQYFDTSINAPPVVAEDGTIIFGTYVSGGQSEYAHIYAVNSDGSLKWKFPIHRRYSINPGIVAPLTLDRDNNLFACTDNGACYGISASGEKLWEYLVHEYLEVRTAPFLTSDEEILVLGQNAILYMLVPGTGKLYLPVLENINN